MGCKRRKHISFIELINVEDASMARTINFNWILTMGFLTKMNVSVGCIGILNLVLNKIGFFSYYALFVVGSCLYLWWIWIGSGKCRK